MCDGNCEAWNGQEEEEDVTGWSWTGEGRSACVWEEEGGGRLEERGEIISYEESAGDEGRLWVGGGGLMALGAASIRPSTHWMRE